MTQGYYRWPTVHGDDVTFVCEDDLWTAPLAGGVARRLTAGLGQIAYPAYSPDGAQLAFTASDEGHPEAYLMPAAGGPTERLTFFGAVTQVVRWTPDGCAVICRSTARQVMRRLMELYAVPVALDASQGAAPQPLGYGVAHDIAYGPGGALVIGRHTLDPARWKRYRGGTKGDLWIDRDGAGTFRRLIELDGNLASPMWIGDRVYFVSDHEGVGNLYSCDRDGADLRRHTDHQDFYARFPSTDGRTIVYHAGGDLFAFAPSADQSHRIDVDWRSPQVQRQRKFVPPSRFLNGYHLHPQGHSMALTTRGRPFTTGLWEGAVLQHGEPDGVRYRFAQYLHDGERLVALSDADGEERLEVRRADGSAPPDRFDGLDLGSPDDLAVCPTANRLALTNHRSQLVLVDLDQRTATVLDTCENHAGFEGLSWSPDGAWLAYGFWDTPNTSIIKVCNVATGETTAATRPVLRDFAPAFDRDGKYLFFLSAREFNPVYDEMHFELGFPQGTRPCLVTLRKDLRSPFIPEPRAPGEVEAKKKSATGEPEASACDSKPSAEKDEKKPEPVMIDLAGLADRVVAFPVSEGRYRQIASLGGKVLYTVWPIEGAINRSWQDAEPEPKGVLKAFDFAAQEEQTVIAGITDFTLSLDGKTMAVRCGERIRVLPAGEKPKENGPQADKPGRKSGWIDLGRLRVSVTPPLEWRQMYAEAWRRMRDHFWTPTMSEVDWRAIRDRYLPLLDRVACRSEVSDLIWELQGELGTSHAYEFGGDYRPEPRYRQGLLGADLVWDAERGGYRITHLVVGDTWDEKRGGPLAKPGLNVRVGDVLTAVNSRPLLPDLPPDRALVNCADTDVLLTLAAADDQPARTIQVKAIGDDSAARYRDWVEAHRERVHKETGGRVGYIHVPDMMPPGFAEFHRTFLAECQRDALLIDVRGNGGGHVSQLLLEKLARRRLGYDIPRWGKPEPYPAYAVLGPVLALTNELAGSDGDIFSHCFKLMKLGPLVGKRTWGGVIGISARERLVDGTLVTQPEYSFWFRDVGWGVENYGTDPDIVVEYPPQDYRAGRDPQLDRAIAELLRMLDETRPAVPDFSQRPSLKPRPLPPRT
jgi:tricorn protease